MIITRTSISYSKRGSIRGSFSVKDGSRRYKVHFSRSGDGQIDQWGAGTDVLCFTWSAMERILTQQY